MTAIEKLITEQLDIWSSSVVTQSTVGRGKRSKLQLYGIKKLRELILELAVRGQLVPQDPNDEPASVLLEKIAVERTQLIKNKKLKKPKSLPQIANNEKPYPLPNKWEFVRLIDIISISSGDGLTSANMNKEGLIPVFGGNGITGQHNQNNVYKPTLVIGRVGFYCGSVHITPQKAWVTDNAFITNFSEKSLYLNFLYWLLKNTNLNQNNSATAQPVISGRKIYPIVVGLPPLAEQHRIVTKVNELMSLCDTLEQAQESSIHAHQTLVENLLNALTHAADQGDFDQAWTRIATHFDTLFTTEHSIDQLKQTILQLAVMGKLVTQDPEDEPASVLLAKIAAEKAQLIKAKKIKKQKVSPPIKEEEKPFELPEGWEWVRLSDSLKKITDGTHHSPPSTETGDYLYISAKNIKPSGIQLTNVTYITKKLHDEIFSRCNPECGDILYIKDGATTGIATINDLKTPFSMLSSVALLKTTKHVFNRYLLMTLIAPYFYKEMRAGMTGVAITRVTLKKLNLAKISLPPLAEQKRIVTKVDQLLSLCDQLKNQITNAKTTQQHLADVLTNQTVNS